MSAWKQWWNGLFHNRRPDDDLVEFLIDVLGFLPIQIAVIVLLFTGFAIYIRYLDWRYLGKPFLPWQQEKNNDAH